MCESGWKRSHEYAPATPACAATEAGPPREPGAERLVGAMSPQDDPKEPRGPGRGRFRDAAPLTPSTASAAMPGLVPALRRHAMASVASSPAEMRRPSASSNASFSSAIDSGRALGRLPTILHSPGSVLGLHAALYSAVAAAAESWVALHRNHRWSAPDAPNELWPVSSTALRQTTAKSSISGRPQ